MKGDGWRVVRCIFLYVGAMGSRVWGEGLSLVAVQGPSWKTCPIPASLARFVFWLDIFLFRFFYTWQKPEFLKCDGKSVSHRVCRGRDLGVPPLVLFQ